MKNEINQVNREHAMVSHHSSQKRIPNEIANEWGIAQYLNPPGFPRLSNHWKKRTPRERKESTKNSIETVFKRIIEKSSQMREVENNLKIAISNADLSSEMKIVLTLGWETHQFRDVENVLRLIKQGNDIEAEIKKIGEPEPDKAHTKLPTRTWY